MPVVRTAGIGGDLDHHTLDAAGQPGRGPASRFRLRGRGPVTPDEVLILARDLVETACSGSVSATIVSWRSGRPPGLENKRCRHPLYDRDSLLILGDHVTLEAGTGCVHTAPGHGREDYDVGLQYGLDAYSPVNDNGCFTDEVEPVRRPVRFQGQCRPSTDPGESGALLAGEKINHSYPHCWRCKQPVIFRATPQWFISMEKNGLRKNALTGDRPGQAGFPTGAGSASTA
jgi:isoleucyl-tRNA synthetase